MRREEVKIVEKRTKDCGSRDGGRWLSVVERTGDFDREE